MFTIGEFSRITGLTIKTIRLYHEKGLIIPRRVDEWTNYRYYDTENVEQARAIRYLRELNLPLSEIGEIVGSFTDDAELLDSLVTHRARIERQLSQLRSVQRSIDEIIARERESRAVALNQDRVAEERTLEDVTIASVRWKGKYADSGVAFSRLFKRAYRHAKSKPFNLYHDECFKEDDADIESCVVVGPGISSIDGLNVRQLQGGPCVSLVFRGSYDQLEIPYTRLTEYVHENGLKIICPIREIYLKGPGVIFRGNPKNYLTEIQFLVEEVSDGKDGFQEGT
ncbi:MAG: MerR family transcriptional regulator [Acidobacteriota bacterium]|nr:MAG: MerR family transcriptional regulator [Acidobacteriota bacterium]